MKPLTKFSEIVVTLAENSAFIAALALIPNIKPSWLITAHIVVLGCKAWYYKDKKTVSINTKETQKDEVDIWQ